MTTGAGVVTATSRLPIPDQLQALQSRERDEIGGSQLAIIYAKLKSGQLQKARHSISSRDA